MTLQDLLGDKYKDGITIEEVGKALEGIELIPKATLENYVPKETYGKATSDAASWKKKYRETLDDATRKQQEAEEHQKTIEEQLAAYKRNSDISNLKSKFLSIGYDAELAEKSAIAQVDGNTDVLFKNMQIHEQQLKEAFKDTVQNNTPAPPVGGNATPAAVTAETAVNDPLGYVSQIIEQSKEE